MIERILPLVRNHMAHFHEVTDRSIRRLARRVAPETIETLSTLMTADAFGRPPRPRLIPPTVRVIEERAAELRVRHHPPEPILRGRHLIAAGLKPGKTFGKILDAAYEAQLEGKFFDLEGAQRWFSEYGKTSNQ
jgi:tRNA nucleotidyltransferase (CCA-adding enzyme)